MSEIILIEDDFDLEKIRVSGQCFRICAFEDGWYRAIARDKVLRIRRLDNAASTPGEVSCAGASAASFSGRESSLYEVSCTKDEWDGFWSGYFDLGRDYGAIREECCGKNAFVDEAMEYGRGLRILRQDPWEMLVTFIISQRKNMPAIARAVDEVSSRFGTRLEDGSFAFPTVEQLAGAGEAQLRECGLGYRAPYIAKTAQQVLSGEIDLEELGALDDAALFEGLKAAHGVGDKVANCVCLFGYGRMSQVPIDVWIARAIAQEGQGDELFDQYGPYAGIMQQYVFFYMTDRNR